MSESQPGWTLVNVPETDGETRTVRSRVSFERPFSGSPVVHVGITGFDIDNRANARLNVDIVGIDETGFELELRTWLNSRLWSVDLSWIAIGH